MDTWVTGQVISNAPRDDREPIPPAGPGNTLRGDICITHHQQTIFIIAPECPTRKPDALVERLYREMDPETVKHIPASEYDVGRYEGVHDGHKLTIAEECIPPLLLDLKLETYVRLSSLSKELQTQVRAEMRR